jgi:uncharacterized RDD family membrane protein YckC
MNSPDTQPGLDPPEYFDPDMPDMSEQEFSASLEAPVELPKFVLDVPKERGSPEAAELGGEAPPQVEAPELDRAAAFSEQAPNASPYSEESASGPDEHDWRNQVSAKVSHYRSRKPRKDRYPSLQLQFEGSPLRYQTPPQATPDASAETRTWAENPEVQSGRETPVMLEATARVLEFPRSGAMPSRDEELAEPVMARPRIVEAPELLPPPPALGGILIEPTAAEEMDRLPGLDVPLQSSPFSRRLLAGAVDATVVCIALAAFAYIFFRINGIPPSRIAAETMAALLAVLWPAYQYAFLVFSKTTPGLRLACLEVTRFDGAPASRSLRRWRVLASLLSWASLGLGYAWCFLDEDQLSWHDRITRTHLGAAPSGRFQDQLQKQPPINAD